MSNIPKRQIPRIESSSGIRCEGAKEWLPVVGVSISCTLKITYK